MISEIACVDYVWIMCEIVYMCPVNVLLSLEVTLQKRSEGLMWPELVMGDRRGEYVMSDEQAALIHERLTHLTSEDLVRLTHYHVLITWLRPVMASLF